MTLRLIWAEAHDRVVGLDGGIPWRLPEEQRLFKERTLGATVVMGRATWDSLPATRRPLPDRRNVVLTRTPGWAAAGASAVGSAEEVLALPGDVWVIGGAGVWAALLPFADGVVRSEIDLAVPGDTFAPALGPQWRAEPGEWRTSAGGVRFRVVELARA